MAAGALRPDALSQAASRKLVPIHYLDFAYYTGE
jgi:hypothetical protein